MSDDELPVKALSTFYKNVKHSCVTNIKIIIPFINDQRSANYLANITYDEIIRAQRINDLATRTNILALISIVIRTAKNHQILQNIYK